MRLVSWNVNGLRSVANKGFQEWFMKEKPEILCLQETKAWDEQLGKDVRDIDGYQFFISRPARKGYSGVATYSSMPPRHIGYGFSPRFDDEGRVCITRFDEFTLLNVYFPNGKASEERLRYKMDFYEEFLTYCKGLLEQGERLVVCGDVNTAHKEIDLARPKENSVISGFLPEEREWIDRFLDIGFIDSLRYFDDRPHLYTWWSMRSGARARNVGWRIDYFLVSENLRGNMVSAGIMPDVMGSDHCPIYLDLSF